MLAFTAGIALLTGVYCSHWLCRPGRRSRPHGRPRLREIGRAGETRFRRLFGKSLVVAQVALSLVLLERRVSLFVRHLVESPPCGASIWASAAITFC